MFMLSALLASVIAGQPSPSPQPLKTIVRVRSSVFCTTLHGNVGRVVKALIQNNVVIDDTKSLLLKLARDKVSSANRTMDIDMDVNRLGPGIDEMAQNLAAAQAQLNDSRHFPAKPRTDDERRLLEMQRQLRAIIDHQNEALNILSGTFYSYNGNRLMGYSDGLKAPVSAASPAPMTSPSPVPFAFASAAQLSGATPSPAGTPASVDLGLLGMTKFAALFNNLTTYQLNEQSLEAQAAATILQSSADCNASH